jgi:hypothetical protein
MAIELRDITTSTRGRNPRQIVYKGIGKVSRAEGEKSDTVDVSGEVTSWKEFVELVQANVKDGNVQTALDMAADGYNLYFRELALETDEFAGLLDGIDWTAVAKKAQLEDKTTEGGKFISAVETAKGQFKRSVRVMAEQSGEDIPAIVTFLSGKLPKVKAA